MVESTLLGALHEREAIYSAIVNQANDSISLVEVETGRLVEFNLAACRNLGYTPEEFARLRVHDVEAEQDSTQIEAVFAKIMQNDGAVFETRHRCKNGEIREVRVSARLVQVGGRHYFAAIWSDITERKRSEQRLRSSEAALKEAQSVAQLGSWSLDIANNALSWSQETHRIFGVAETTPLTLRFFLECVHPDDQDRVRAAWNAALVGAPYDLEHRILVHGVTRWVRERARVHFDAAGQPISAIGTVQDISERRQIETELARYRNHLEQLVRERTAQLEAANRELIRARNAAEAANRAKSTFLTTMSHEIRTPINAVIGLTHLLQRDISNPRQHKSLSQIAEAAHHLMEMVNDILELSKIEAGKLRLERINFALAAILDNLHVALNAKAAAKGLTLTQSIDPALPPVLHGDPVRLRQILFNFASNAVKFTEHGVITLRALRIPHPGFSADQVRVRFEIQDTGIGIEPDDQARLFQAFEQADSSTTRKYGGVGLGLAVNRRLIELMDGELGVSSAPGAGSTFWFAVTLPHAQSALKSAVPALAAAEQPPAAAKAAGQSQAAPGAPLPHRDSRQAEAAAQAAARLQTLLAEDDLRASQAFADTAPLLRAWLGDPVGRIEQHIDAFEYQRALHVLQALIADADYADIAPRGEP